LWGGAGRGGGGAGLGWYCTEEGTWRTNKDSVVLLCGISVTLFILNNINFTQCGFPKKNTASKKLTPSAGSGFIVL
jgi:hypothetical protein